MSDKVIVLAAGHGKKPDGSFDNGAYNQDGTKEHDINIKVRNFAIAELSRYNCRVISDQGLLGNANTDPNWAGLGQYFRSHTPKPDLLVEIHHDSPNAKRAGFGILPKTIFKKSITKLAGDIAAQYVKRGLPIKPSYSDVRGLGLLRVLAYPSLIWECNITEHTADVILKARGEGIAQGIVVWAGLSIDMFKDGLPRWDVLEHSKAVLEYLHLDNNITTAEYNAAVIKWKTDHGFYASTILEPFHLKLMGIV